MGWPVVGKDGCPVSRHDCKRISLVSGVLSCDNFGLIVMVRVRTTWEVLRAIG